MFELRLWDQMVDNSHLEYPDAWIKGVSTLYGHASSSILFAGEYRLLFPISKCLRQGCPLAPFPFILFGEALSSYLRSSSAGIKGIALPFTHVIILDVEFANDATFYVDGDW